MPLPAPVMNTTIPSKLISWPLASVTFGLPRVLPSKAALQIPAHDDRGSPDQISTEVRPLPQRTVPDTL